ncbi:UPF0149 family protein [Sphingomonas sp. GC_Shp_3]|uniref:UPF0149 family protein n=1 Tax=Sphingomonas sp. GC_Shp_3 TaxID=2937383 RepID=UPI002269B58E|nr:UPF0149 family protein [Sphingomonas sp. GC_Shp_3]
MPSPIFRFPSRFRRLDEILADLPIDDPLLLTELDGYLTAVAVCPERMVVDEWLPPIWGGAYGEGAPFEDPLDVRLFADMVQARLDEILRDLARGRHQPILDVDPRNGEPLWEEWIGGFAMAMEVRPQSWSAAQGDAAAALADLRTLIAVASDAATLTADEINAICDTAPARIPADVLRLFARDGRDAAAAPAASAKPGRNDPCACGSGKKFKRCCG